MYALITETETLSPNFRDDLGQVNLQYDVFESEDDVVDCAKYDIVFGGLIVKHRGLEAFKNVKWIQVSSAGYNHLPIQDWKEHDILVTNAKDVFSQPIAEHVIFYTLMHYKRGLEHLKLQEDKIFTRLNNKELEDEVVCILGTGSIASNIAKRFKPFNVKLIGINTDGRIVDGFDECYAMSELKKILSISDIVIMTLPLTDKTRYFFDETYLQSMKKGSILINVGRGRIIDEKALVNCLESEHIAFAVLDVMETEPLPQDSILWTTKNLLITPHDSGVSSKTGIRLIQLFIKNIQAYQNNKPLTHLV